MRILIVDDDPTSLLIMSATLNQWKHEVAVASDGLEALALLKAEDNISLVISDWNMPGMDGPELCHSLRAGAISRYIYFILLTIREDKASLVEGMEAGADDFLVKPFDQEELRVRIRAGERILKLEQQLAERSRELEQDLAAAATLQQALLPPPTRIQDIMLDWLFIPSRFLAGDMFGYFSIDENYLGFYQLDVAGHGIRSALRSIALNTLLSQGVTWTGLMQKSFPRSSYSVIVPPEQVVRELNRRFMEEIDSALYFTMIYGVIETRAGRVTLTQAGHPAPLWLRRQAGNIERLGTGGFPVALLPDIEYDALSFTLAAGDRLFLYSDGITECANSAGELFTEPRLLEVLQATADCSLPRSIQAVERALRQWKGDEQYQDDISLLALERVMG